MTPKEKAIELIDRYDKVDGTSYECEYISKLMAKDCALITIDEILNMLDGLLMTPKESIAYKYYLEVKQEIENI